MGEADIDTVLAGINASCGFKQLARFRCKAFVVRSRGNFLSDMGESRIDGLIIECVFVYSRAGYGSSVSAIDMAMAWLTPTSTLPGYVNVPTARGLLYLCLY